MKLAIIGAAELGKLIAYHAKEDAGYDVVGFYDDFNTAATFDGLPLLGKTERLLDDYQDKKFDRIIMAIGYNQMRSRAGIFNTFKSKIPFANVIHSSAYVDKSCVLGEGIFILPRVVCDLGVMIGDNVLINVGSIVAHHTKIGRHSFIAPGVHMAGLIDIGEKCFIGLGAVIKDSISIASGSTIGAGSLVLKSTEPNSVSVGAPAKVVKYNEL